MSKRRRYYTKAEERRALAQWGQLKALPCAVLWSDGRTTASTLKDGFDGHKHYRAYKRYKDKGGVFPVRVKAMELTAEEKEQPSTIFPTGERGGDQYMQESMCRGVTDNLRTYLELDEETIARAEMLAAEGDGDAISCLEEETERELRKLIAEETQIKIVRERVWRPE